jgi:hypothetical protein
MPRTRAGEVFYDEVGKETLRGVVWRMAEFYDIQVVTS